MSRVPASERHAQLSSLPELLALVAHNTTLATQFLEHNAQLHSAQRRLSMATPSSSGTSPSPALSYTLPTSASENSTDDPNDQEQAEREERRKKLLARTEFAKITRALRTTLAFASYKAKHNVTTVPLSTLEARVAQRSHYPNNAPSSQATPALFPATFGNDKKRKASTTASNAHFYNSPLSQGTGSYGIGGVGLGANTASTSMGMPSPHASYTFPPPSPSTPSGPTNPSKSLFASILALPPAKRARTIHNPEAPPVPPPLPPPQPQSRRSPKKSMKKGKEPSGGGKGRGGDKKGKGKEREKKKVSGRARANSISSIHTHSSFSADTENVNDTDMKAAETLTDLLFSRTGGTASPRSSFSAPTSASRTGPGGPTRNAHALSHASSGSSMPVSAASQHRAHVRTASNASTASVGTSIVERPSPADERMDTRRSATPTVTPRLPPRTTGSGSGSLSAQASHVFSSSSASGRAEDSEAADLMLLLANSPSPARPTARDHDISRNAYAAGRVLFPSGPSGGERGSDAGSSVGRGVKRSMGESSVSSIESGDGIRENGRRAGSETATTPPSSQGEVSPPQVPRTVVTPPLQEGDDRSITPSNNVLPGQKISPGQLLPSPPSLNQTGPQTPAFRLTDYINVTPSPAPSAPSHGPSTQAASSYPSQLYPPALGSAPGPPIRYGSAVSVSSPLRKSFDRENLTLGSNLPGRRLFENEPGGTNVGDSGNGAERKMRFGESGDRAGSLGSGIDLVQTLK